MGVGAQKRRIGSISMEGSLSKLDGNQTIGTNVGFHADRTLGGQSKLMQSLLLGSRIKILSRARTWEWRSRENKSLLPQQSLPGPSSGVASLASLVPAWPRRLVSQMWNCRRRVVSWLPLPKPECCFRSVRKNRSSETGCPTTATGGPPRSNGFDILTCRCLCYALGGRRPSQLDDGPNGCHRQQMQAFWNARRKGTIPTLFTMLRVVAVVCRPATASAQSSRSTETDRQTGL